MEPETINTIINTLKKERIDLVVTLPEEPTFPLIEEIRQDPYFSSITEQLTMSVKPALEGQELSLFVVKSASGRTRIKSIPDSFTVAR